MQTDNRKFDIVPVADSTKNSFFQTRCQNSLPTHLITLICSSSIGTHQKSYRCTLLQQRQRWLVLEETQTVDLWLWWEIYAYTANLNRTLVTDPSPAIRNVHIVWALLYVCTNLQTANFKLYSQLEPVIWMSPENNSVTNSGREFTS